VRSTPSTVKMRPGPPSAVKPARARLPCLVGLLLHIIILLTPVMRMRMTGRSLRCILPLSGLPTWPSATPRSQSKAQSMTIVKLQCMRAANSLMTLASCPFSTLMGIGLSIYTRRCQWWRLSDSTGIGWQQGGM
jgi:hypothetical protein